jgi:hypothetical protein
MKSSFLILLSIIAISVACSAYKSAGSPPLANTNNAQRGPSAQTNIAAAQEQEKTPCTLTLAGAPVIKGLRLGMTPEEVLALFPGSKDDAEVRASLARPPGPLGTSELLIRPAKYESKDKYTGVNQISFTLLDGRVSNLTVSYNGPQYSHVDRFVEKVIADTNLPALGQWEPYVGMDDTLKLLKCGEFEVSVFIGGPGGSLNYVSMKDLVADKLRRDRRAKAREGASPTPEQ